MFVSPKDSLGPYEILGPLVAGSMGEVYRARDVRFDRDVAVKVLPAELATDPNRLRRFGLETRAEGVVDRSNVLTLHAIGTKDGVQFPATEPSEGETLHDLKPTTIVFHLPAVYCNLRCVQEAFARWSAGESYARFLDINAKADPGAPLVEEARRSFGVGRADARVSKVGAGSPQR
jgi:serine/threonine protein kinase